MKHSCITAACFLTLLLTGLTTPAAIAGISWRQTDTSIADGDTSIVHQTIHVTGARFAIDSETGERIIVDGGDGTVSIVDPASEAYFTATLDELSNMRENALAETERLMEDALKQLPPDQREVYREMMKERLEEERAETAPEGPSWEDFRNTGERDTMLGHPVTRYIARTGDSTVHEAWCSRAIDTSELESFFETVKQSSLFENIGNSFSLIRYGFPLKYRITGAGQFHESVVTSLSRDEIPESVFTVPDGYIRRELPASAP